MQAFRITEGQLALFSRRAASAILPAGSSKLPASEEVKTEELPVLSGIWKTVLQARLGNTVLAAVSARNLGLEMGQ